MFKFVQLSRIKLLLLVPPTTRYKSIFEEEEEEKTSSERLKAEALHFKIHDFPLERRNNSKYRRFSITCVFSDAVYSLYIKRYNITCNFKCRTSQ